MPGAFVINASGFSEDDILALKEYARDNEPLFWEFSRVGGDLVEHLEKILDDAKKFFQEISVFDYSKLA